MGKSRVTHLSKGDQAFSDLVDVLLNKKTTRVIVAYYQEGDDEMHPGWSFVRASRLPSPKSRATTEDVGAATLLSQYVSFWFDEATQGETTHEIPDHDTEE